MLSNNFSRTLSFFIFPAFVFLLSEFLGIIFDVYSVYWWFDIPMHFLGGVAISFMVVLFLKFFKEKKILEIRSKLLFVLTTLAFVVLISVMWEFYEFLRFYFFGFELGTNVDMTTDLLMGFIGGLVGGIGFRRL